MTISDFENKISEKIAERTKVLTEIEIALFTQRYRLSKKHLDIFSVQSVAMIYAIWEGFIQQSFQLYIDYLNELHLDFNKFSDEIRVFHMENTFKQFYDYPKKSKKKIEFYNKLKLFYSDEYHPISRTINTDSNVSFEILNTLLKSFCLEPFQEHWNQYTHPKPNLKESLKTFLRYRNSVAHGGDVSAEEKVTQDVYTKYKKLVTDLMYEIQDRMTSGLKQKTYLLSS